MMCVRIFPCFRYGGSLGGPAGDVCKDLPLF